ncbi:YopX family protein [Bacillus subtilis]|uniref:YopX family protein n=1 Tax=Bacillus subtilis TaxID=1423 RepID=UPI0029C55383|nr:YopX family protein [Bacillus subtilis]MDX6157103.1 YopX family protein [Bacillus subtilis]
MNTAYRVWDGEQMHYWDDEHLSLTIKNDGSWLLWHDSGGGCVVSSDDKDAALMWGIGLKDKNGKDIYEYDIDMIDNEPMIVVYIDGRFGLKYPENHTYFDDCIAWDECDIRGDVYQNPELLEGAE